ncbi:TPA: hypothetical protein NPO68_005133 [Klebsiella pneumoniae]|nr:hypothetical protein [Klebsiella pneumoniae]
MSSIRTLTFEEITKVSGGEGHGSEWARDKRDAAMNASLNGAGAGYGAIPNIDVVALMLPVNTFFQMDNVSRLCFLVLLKV